MNCDQVFEVLTRGPFPTGTDCDEPVESHLCACPQCRRLAEALRPALELFQEAVDPEESRDLPGYWSGVGSDGTRAAVSYAAETEPRPAAKRRGAVGPLARLTPIWSSANVWRMAAMLLLGVTVGSLAGARIDIDELPWWPGSAPAAPAAAQDDAPRANLADGMRFRDLSTVCFRDALVGEVPGGQLLARADMAGLSCCSGCHNATSDAASGTATANVAQSCQLCHVEPPISPPSAAR